MLDFLCIGAQKAGTSWLFRQLDQNPNVWVHPFKELHYFDHLYCPENRNWTLWHLQKSAADHLQAEAAQKRIMSRFDHVSFLIRSADRDWAFTEDWYRYCFSRAPAGKLRGECTPEYSAIGPQGIEQIKRMMPKVRLLYLIRDPVSRAWSQIRMNLGRGNRLKEAAANLESVLLSEARLPAIESRGNYAQYIADWDSAYAGTNQLMYVPYRRIASEPEKLLDEIERHIGVGRGDRSLMNKRVWESPSIAMPSSVQEVLQDMLKPQYAFLKDRFGPEFVAQI